MKYKVKNEGFNFIHDDNLLETLLIDRDVDNPEMLLNLTEDCVHDGMLFTNMKEAIELYKESVLGAERTCRIHIPVDSDCDGFTSAAIITNYTQDLCQAEGIEADITYSLHKGKEHGIVLSELDLDDFDLLIVTDAGSNDIVQSKKLSELGINVLILDHHTIEEVNDYAIVVNCKDGTYPNRNLSGAGVVYKFCKEVDRELGYDFANNYLDLFALGNIADGMDLRSYETRYLCLKGVEKFVDNNLYLQEVVEKQAFSIGDSLNITKVGWFIAPLINAVVRTGTYEEKVDVFRALIGEEETREYTPRKSKNNQNPIAETQSLQKTMARECVNIKARQDAKVKKGLELLKQQVDDEKLDNRKVLIVNGSEDLDKNFTGLVANKFASAYNKPVIILRERAFDEDNTEIIKDDGEIYYGGSGRNCNLSPIENFQTFLQNLNVFEYVSGHDNAFGFLIKQSKLDLLKAKIDTELKNVIMENVYTVDYAVPIGRLKPTHILNVGQWKDLWGNQLQEPLFAITDIYIPTDKIKLLGEKKNVLKFEVRDISFIKRFANEDYYNKMICKQAVGLSKKRVEKVKMEIIGKMVINEWEGKEYPQIEIVDFNSEEDNKIMF